VTKALCARKSMLIPSASAAAAAAEEERISGHHQQSVPSIVTDLPKYCKGDYILLHYSITLRSFYNRCVILCYHYNLFTYHFARFAFVLQPLCYHFATSLLLLCDRFAIPFVDASKSLCNCFAIPLQLSTALLSLLFNRSCNRCAVFIHSLCERFIIALLLPRYRMATTLHPLINAFAK
jgi:hypothetical protein